MRTKPHSIPWAGVVIIPWNHTNLNGDPNHYHIHNPNTNSPNWTMASAEPFANKCSSQRSTESVLRLLFCAHMHCIVYKYLLVDPDIVILCTSYSVIFTLALSPSCFASNLIYNYWGFNPVILIPRSQRTFLELENRSTLTCPQYFSAELNVCEHHCSWCVISYLNLQPPISIRCNYGLNTNH